MIPVYLDIFVQHDIVAMRRKLIDIIQVSLRFYILVKTQALFWHSLE